MALFDSVVRWISTTFAVCASSIIAVIMLLTTADVIKRYITGSSLPGVTEFSEVFLVAAVFLGLAFAMRIGSHIGVDIVITRLRPRVSRAVQTIGMVIALVVLTWMAIETIGTAAHSIAINEFRYGLIKVPVWPAKILIPVGLSALILECVVFLVKLYRPDRSGENPPATTAGENPPAEASARAADTPVDAQSKE